MPLTDAQHRAAENQNKRYRTIRLRHETWAAILKEARPNYGDTADTIIRRVAGLKPLGRRWNTRPTRWE